VQVGVESVRDAEEGVDPRRPAAALEAGDCGMGSAHQLGELGLREPPFLAPVGDLAGDLREEPALLGAGEPRTNSFHGLTHISIMLYIAIVRYSLSIAPFLGLVVVAADQQGFFTNDAAVMACLVLAPMALGAVTGRWWALCVPLVAALVAIPFGLPNAAEGEPFPTWFNLLFVSPVLIALVAAGVGGRKLWNRWREAAVA
jgi:hypothetical protein